MTPTAVLLIHISDVTLVQAFYGWKGMEHYRGKGLIRPVTAEIIMYLSYSLILISFQHVHNVSYVSVFRQIILLPGVYLAIYVLKEKIFLPRIIGSVIITTGFAGLLFFTERENLLHEKEKAY